jgi:quinol monooxygenase YgiN
MVLVIGRGRCAPEDRERLVVAGREMQEKTRAEDGCISYGFFTAIEDRNQFVVVEEWTDRAALDRHFQTPHLQEFGRVLTELVEGAPEVAFHDVADPA